MSRAPAATRGADDRAQVRYARRALSVTVLASILVGLNQSTLNVALPDVVRHFHASAVASSWILLSYMLTNTALLIGCGRLSDMFGRRTMYLSGLGVFTAASFMCGLAPGAWVLVGLRVVQAAGASMILANSAAIITDSFPVRLLHQGFGVYTASFSVAQLVGPSIGGFIADSADWRWVFWFNVPVGVLCLGWGAVTLRRSDQARGRPRIDVPGNLLLFCGLGFLLIALSETQELGWANPVTIGGAAVAAVLLPVFVLVERHTSQPVFDVRLFRDRSFAAANVSQFINTVARFGIVLLIALLFQAAYGDDPFTAGLKVMPLPVGTMVAAVAVGFLGRWAGPRALAVLGSAITAAGLFVLYITLSPHPSYPVVAVGLVLVGLGSGIFLPSNTTAIMMGVPKSRLGAVNALRLMLQNVGLVMSAAVSLTLITSPLPEQLRHQVFAGTVSRVSRHAVQALVDGYRLTLLAMVVVALLGTLAALASRTVEARTVAREGVDRLRGG